ncbi:MAG: tetratricopeptide repeat protein [Bacteroidales bacterium]|nr:tetratricopeptide repeat protein [Bacteroidales bacterium]MDD4656344.1 tetratricopeptide repeat protein [Bacteroidales bacterium]
MSKKIKHQDPEESVENALNVTEQFIENHKNKLVYSVIAILLITTIGFAYHHYYRKPLKEEALGQTFIAEQYFSADSFAVALNGDGNSLGFKQVIDEYGSAAPKSVFMYAGVCELHLGNFNEAISYLKKYKSKDPVMQARAIANIGDAYAGLMNNTEALNYYLKAASYSDNVLAAAYMLKAGIMQEELGNNSAAIKLYEEIKVKYPQSQEGIEADKFIARISVK